MELLTANQLAKLLNVGVRTVWRWRDMGAIPAPVKIGGAVRGRRDSIQEWIENDCCDCRVFGRGK